MLKKRKNTGQFFNSQYFYLLLIAYFYKTDRLASFYKINSKFLSKINENICSRIEVSPPPYMTSLMKFPKINSHLLNNLILIIFLNHLTPPLFTTTLTFSRKTIPSLLNLFAIFHKMCIIHCINQGINVTSFFNISY